MTNNTRTLIHKLKKHQDEIPYFMISREVVQSIDNPLALAIWVYLQSKADDWKVIEADIMKQFKVGRTSYLKAMKCLREAQLYSVERYKNEENQFVGSVFHVYETPTSTDFHTYGEPHVWESTHTETHTYIKEEEITTEKEINTEDVYQKFDLSGFDDFEKEIAMQVIDYRKSIKSPLKTIAGVKGRVTDIQDVMTKHKLTLKKVMDLMSSNEWKTIKKSFNCFETEQPKKGTVDGMSDVKKATIQMRINAKNTARLAS